MTQAMAMPTTASSTSTSSTSTSSTSLPSTKRLWQAYLQLDFANSRGATRIVRNKHLGPLRVLKPFYPEGEVCHTYLIHPPGGLVLGDQLNIAVKALDGAHALITTPSAGKVYNTNHALEKQAQTVNLSLAGNTCVEWLPQETLVFDGANVELATHVEMTSRSQLALWDIVCLGRPANKLAFEKGQCLQKIHINIDGLPRLIERNLIKAGTELQQASWGLQSNDTLGTFIQTVTTTRDERENLQHYLYEKFGKQHQWGITQKETLCIVRYLGKSAVICRQGFEIIWQQLRPKLCQRPAISPRIWLT